jgi:hypothetical protein
VFHAASLVLGIPSCIAFVFLAWESVRLHLMTPAATNAGPSGNQLINLFIGGFRLFGKLFAFLGEAGKWVILMLAVASFLALVFAVMLFFTARGLNAGQLWARTFGILLAIGPLLFSLGILLSLRSFVPFTLSATVAAGAAWVIYTPGWRFA